MRFTDDLDLKNTYTQILQEDDDEINLDDDDTDDVNDKILAGLDEIDQKMHLLGHNLEYTVPTNLKTQYYKVDVSGVTPGTLSQKALAKALQTVRVNTPPTWQFAIQKEINLPVTLKIGRNTILKNACAYVFDYDTVKNNPGLVSGTLLNNADYLSAKFGFKFLKIYVYLRYIPIPRKEIKWSEYRNYNKKTSGIRFPQQPVYDNIVVGTINDKPAAIASFMRFQRSVIVYGPNKCVEFRDLTFDGVVTDQLNYMMNRATTGKQKKQLQALYDLANKNNLESGKILPSVKTSCEKRILNTAKSIGIMESYNEQLTEQTHGHWKVRANVPGRGDITATVAGDQKSDRRYILGKFASKYMPRNDIGWWVDANEDKAIITWVPAKSSGKVLSPDNYIEWPAMNRPKQ